MKKVESRPKQVKKEVLTSGKPLMSSEASASPTRTRRNKAGSIERTDRFSNIEKGMIPFHYSNSNYGTKTSSIDVRDTVMLCQKAYYNFPVFRNTIDLMTEFSLSKLYLRGGSKKSRDFFSALFQKINLWDLQDRFFREYYRSGNVFLYRFDAKIDKKYLNKMTKTFGGFGLERSYIVPIRYCILNPADVHVSGNISFAANTYYKQLSGYELERLRNPRTQEDEEVLRSLAPELRKKIKERVSQLLMPLDVARINAVFYKKMDYEPFCGPNGLSGTRRYQLESRNEKDGHGHSSDYATDRSSGYHGGRTRKGGD